MPALPTSLVGRPQNSAEKAGEKGLTREGLGQRERAPCSGLLVADVAEGRHRRDWRLPREPPLLPLAVRKAHRYVASACVACRWLGWEAQRCCFGLLHRQMQLLQLEDVNIDGQKTPASLQVMLSPCARSRTPVHVAQKVAVTL